MIHNCVLNCGKIPKDFPRGFWDGKDSGTVMYLVGQGNPEDIPKSQGDFGTGRTVVL